MFPYCKWMRSEEDLLHEKWGESRHPYLRSLLLEHIPSQDSMRTQDVMSRPAKADRIATNYGFHSSRTNQQVEQTTAVFPPSLRWYEVPQRYGATGKSRSSYGRNSSRLGRYQKYNTLKLQLLLLYMI